MTLLEHISLDRVLLLVFLAGELYGRFKSSRTSLRDQGRRIGGHDRELAELAGRVAALEASRGRA